MSHAFSHLWILTLNRQIRVFHFGNTQKCQEITNKQRFSREKEERECIGIKGYKGIMEQKGINWWRAKKKHTERVK